MNKNDSLSDRMKNNYENRSRHYLTRRTPVIIRLDEAAGAYKDIDTVMENQKDLVEIVTELRPLAVIKG